MRVLVACEFSGIVRDAFAKRGHDAWSCDLLPTELDGQHIQDDVLKHLDEGWDLMIAHPPCTYLCKASAHLWKHRISKAQQAVGFIIALWEAPIQRVAIENPVGQIPKLWRRYDQIIQPSHFGEPYLKQTCLWLRNLPPLMATVVHTDTKPWVDSTNEYRRHLQHRGVRSSKNRSRTFPGIAEAMAEQWGFLE